MKMKKYSKVLFLVLLMMLLVGCGKTASDDTVELPKASEEDYKMLIEEQESTAFEFKFDPTLNEVAMKDVIADENAIYGFSPNPDSERLGSYAEYDWSDSEVVESAKQDRIAYHESISTMYTMLKDMLAEDKDIETIARTISAERNRIRLASYDNDPEGLAKVKQSNLDTYGDENGPSADSLFEKYGSWETVLTKAFSANMGMDICLGLYDDYYYSYVELGLIPDTYEEMRKCDTVADFAEKYGSCLNDSFIISADGYKVENIYYMDSEEMYVLEPGDDLYTTIDGELYNAYNGTVSKYCLVGNAQYPEFNEFETSDFDNGISNLAGLKKYDDNNILVTLSVTDEDYITSFEQIYGYGQGEIKELIIKTIISAETFEQSVSELYMITETDSVKIGQATSYTAVPKPEIDQAVLDKINDTSRRSVNIIAANGTPDEKTFSFDMGKDVLAAVLVGDDYNQQLYEDSKYKKEHKNAAKAKKNVTLYVKK